MSTHVIVTIIGPDQTGMVGKVIKVVSDSGLNILDSRMATFGGEFTLTTILEGNLASIARIETALPTLAAELGLLTMIKRTSKHETQVFPCHYQVEYWGEDSSGVLSQVANFFADRNVNIHSLRSSTHQQSPEQPEQMRSELQLAVPNDTDGQALFADFDVLCERLALNSCITQLHSN